MQIFFASYELEVLHYGLLILEKTHPIFKKFITFKNKGVLNLNFVNLYKSLASIMHKSHMEFFLLRMDRYHFVIIMCQHWAHYKACDGLWAKFLFAGFWSTQPCQAPFFLHSENPKYTMLAYLDNL